MELGLAGRVALVSGASRGTGAGIARALASEGAHVLVHGFDRAAAEAVAGAIVEVGGRADAVAGDITTDDGADEVAAAVAALGVAVDVLVNNYGIAQGGGWFEATGASWHELYDRNVVSGVRLVQRFVPAMRARGWGRVVLVSTIGATRPGANLPEYYTAKTALPGLAVSLMKELAGSGITVNTVSPGVIATTEVIEMYTERARRDGRPTDWESVQAHALERSPIPTGRIPTPDDIGRVVAFLASEPAWHLNGVHLRIDGGAVEVVT